MLKNINNTQSSINTDKKSQTIVSSKTDYLIVIFLNLTLAALANFALISEMVVNGFFQTFARGGSFSIIGIIFISFFTYPLFLGLGPAIILAVLTKIAPDLYRPFLKIYWRVLIFTILFWILFMYILG